MTLNDKYKSTRTYTLVKVNGVFTSDNVRDGTSLFLGDSHCCYLSERLDGNDSRLFFLKKSK